MQQTIVVYSLASYCYSANCPHCIPHIAIPGAHKRVPIEDIPFNSEYYKDAIFALEVPKNMSHLIQATESVVAKPSTEGRFFLLMLKKRESIIRFAIEKSFQNWKVKGWNYIISLQGKYGNWEPRIVRNPGDVCEKTLFELSLKEIWRGFSFKPISLNTPS